MDDRTGVPARRGAGWVFRGDEGLRAGWSLLLFALAAMVIGGVLSVAWHYVARGLHLPPRVKGAPGTWWQTLASDMALFATVALASLVVAAVERRPFARYGLRRTAWLRDLVRGMAWGVVMLSVLVGALAALGALRFDGVALSAGPALGYALGWLAAFMAVGLTEEYMTRGFLQYTVARGVAGIVAAVAPRSRHARTIGFWVAAAIFSVGIFVLGHVANSGETAMGLVSVGLAGITFVYVLYRTGSLWWAIGFHGTWDWAQSYLYGVADSGQLVAGHLLVSHAAGAPLLSGGATGPEGSILVVPVLLATIAIIRVTLPRRATAFDAADASLVSSRPG